ncbi:MAG: iron-containing alcohol dehydrogenase [Lentisphaeria bacterium]
MTAAPLSDYALRYPPVIRFGWGVRRELPALLREAAAAPAVFFVGSASALGGGRVEELRELCGGWRGQFFGVHHDPPLAGIDELVARVRDSGANLVVAAGGGSTLDAAKAAAILAPASLPAADVFHGRRPVPNSGLPLFALPTTAGTGAEITNNAVLTDPAAGDKKSIRSPGMIARAALVDVELTLSQPPNLTAWSGLDALTQAVESYLSNRASAPTRALAAAATAKLYAHLPAAVTNGADRAARTAVAEGSLLSAMAFSQSALGAVHGLAHPIGALTGLPHGLTCAILLPHVLRLNAPACGALLDELAAACGLRTGPDLVDAVACLCHDLGVPPDFQAAKLRRERLPDILARCRSNSMGANPRTLTDAEITEFLAPLLAP